MYGMIDCFTVLFLLQNTLNFLKLYYPPLSHLITLILFLVYNFIKILISLNISNTSNLVSMM
jgi:hypothetical protein